MLGAGSLAWEIWCVCLFGINWQESSLSCGVDIGEEMLQKYEKAKMSPARKSLPPWSSFAFVPAPPWRTYSPGRQRSTYPSPCLWVALPQVPLTVTPSHVSFFSGCICSSSQPSSSGSYTLALRDPSSLSSEHLLFSQHQFSKAAWNHPPREQGTLPVWVSYRCSNKLPPT